MSYTIEGNGKDKKLRFTEGGETGRWVTNDHPLLRRSRVSRMAWKLDSRPDITGVNSEDAFSLGLSWIGH